MIKKKYPANKPELKKNCEIVGLFSSSNLQVTISRVRISVLKGRPKRKLGRLRHFCVPVSPLYFILLYYIFLNGLRRTVLCSLSIFTALQYLIETFPVSCIFSLRTDT